MKAFKKILPLLILTAAVLVVFKDLPKTFYQQDEWNGLGLALSEGPKSILDGVGNLADIFLGKGRIASNAIFYVFLSLFPFQNSQMAVFAIFLQLTTSLLVYFLIYRFLKNSTISLLGSLFFALNSVAQGAITWPFVAISTAGSTILILLSVWLFFKLIETSHKKHLFLCTLSLYLSLFFKETGLYLFLFLPAALLLFKKANPTNFLKRFWILWVPFLVFVGYRILSLRLRTTQSNLYLTGASHNFFSVILVRLILYPLTSFSLMFVPGGQFLEFAREILRLNYPFFAPAANNILIAQTVILDLLAIVLTGVILFAMAVLLYKEKIFRAKTVVFWLLFTFLSFTPYVVLSKDFSYLESRYYYLSASGGAILFAWILFRVKQYVGKVAFFSLIVPACLLYLGWHASAIRLAIADQVELSALRMGVMSQLKNSIPTLNSNKNVFYLQSDKNYWTDTNMLPFQQGSGYTFMVLYYNSGKVPNEFLKDGYLFGIGSQGYRESGGTGFGFFYDEKTLDETITKHNLREDSIIRLKYDSKNQKLSKI